MIKNLLRYFVPTSLLLISGCSGNASGGPCDYTNEPVHMRVIEIKLDEANPEYFIVVIDFDGSSLAESPQSLGDLRDVKITEEYLNTNHIKEGVIYTGEVHELTSGDCEPIIIDWNQRFVEN